LIFSVQFSADGKPRQRLMPARAASIPGCSAAISALHPSFHGFHRGGGLMNRQSGSAMPRLLGEQGMGRHAAHAEMVVGDRGVVARVLGQQGIVMDEIVEINGCATMRS
jgi:hypothetical protein